MSIRFIFSALTFASLGLDAFSQDDVVRPSADRTFSQALEEQEHARQKHQETFDRNNQQRAQLFGALPADAPDQIKSDYQNAVETMRSAMKAVRRNYTEYQLSLNSDHDLKRLEQWSEALYACDAAVDKWLTKMASFYGNDPQYYQQLGVTLSEIILHDYPLDQVDHLLMPCHVIFDDPPSTADSNLFQAIGYIAYANNDYELAKAAWDRTLQETSLPARLQSFYDAIPEAEAKWKRELTQREIDKSRDNPFVQLMTAKGIIEVELFEDQAPQAVASFVYLAENNFFQSMKFYRVIPSFGAQTGSRAGDGTGSAGYSIESESAGENRRDIFRGSVFFALGVNQETNRADPNSASSQFVLASAMLPEVNGAVGAFGRITKGQQFLGTFREVDLSVKAERDDPNTKVDFLVNVKIVRKRDHEYKPTIYSGELPY